MAFELDHDSARKLAKALMARTGREIKLKDIYSDIGSLFGMNGDAMMHALKRPSCGQSRREGEDDFFDAVTGLETFERFVKRVEADRSSPILVCVVHVASVHAVESRHGDTAAMVHLREFADLLRVAPSEMFGRRVVAYIGGSYFVAAWPTALEDDHQRQANASLRGWWLRSEQGREKRGLDESHRFELGGCADIVEAGNFNRARFENAVEVMKRKAVNQVLARRELSAFPIARMSY